MVVITFLTSCANQQNMDWATILPIATGGGVLPYLIGAAIDEALPKKGKSTQLKSSDLPNICAKARDGDGTARASVAWHYKNGWAPVSENSVEAYKWFSLASSAGHAEATDYRAALANEMSAEQIAEAEHRAESWSANAEKCEFLTKSADVQPSE